MYAVWKDGYGYPAKVSAVLGTKKKLEYEVIFEDGMKRRVTPQKILNQGMIPVGFEVMASRNSWFEAARITRINDASDDVYEVMFHDKEELRYFPTFTVIA